VRDDSHAAARSYLSLYSHAARLSFVVTEDYSSYESVDEEAPPPEKPAKGKGKGKKALVPAASKSDDEAVEEKAAKAPAKRAPALERKPSKPNAQKGGMASYFTKK
jgi:hypothetical protein